MRNRAIFIIRFILISHHTEIYYIFFYIDGMKKITISAAILFSLCTGVYFAKNLISSEKTNFKECPCTPDCQPEDAWCTCEAAC